jgi:hypothetical protein
VEWVELPHVLSMAMIYLRMPLLEMPVTVFGLKARNRLLQILPLLQSNVRYIQPQLESRH